MLGGQNPKRKKKEKKNQGKREQFGPKNVCQGTGREAMTIGEGKTLQDGLHSQWREKKYRISAGKGLAQAADKKAPSLCSGGGGDPGDLASTWRKVIPGVIPKAGDAVRAESLL